ncbi:hypothetical protein ACFVWN_18645 [Nocardiopsis flavescens]|uniref:hypothetical protein n=1 Tax=Nocardiopsis flavescens TaxID=758803 RepID=UPI0036500B38
MTAVQERVRSVLDAPRGHRFSRTRTRAFAPALAPNPARMTREQRLLRQLAGNPRVAYRTEHGVLPAWMGLAEERRKHEADTAQPPPPPPPPRGRHRALLRRRHRRGWSALAYGTVLAAGVVIGHAAGLLL